jgi:hypothetical protein
MRTLLARRSQSVDFAEAAVPVRSDHPDLLHRRFVPLRRVAAQLRASTIPADAFFDPDGFMLVSWCTPDRPQGVQVYRHVDTRTRLALDVDGRAYRCPPADRGAAWTRHATLRDAVDALDLWELPWLRPDLAAHREGRSWDERFELYEQLTGRDLDRAS